MPRVFDIKDFDYFSNSNNIEKLVKKNRSQVFIFKKNLIIFQNWKSFSEIGLQSLETRFKVMKFG